MVSYQIPRMQTDKCLVGMTDVRSMQMQSEGFSEVSLVWRIPKVASESHQTKAVSCFCPMRLQLYKNCDGSTG